MLVLTRHQGEKICVGHGVVITVVATHHKMVRIGIEAPPDIAVDREEIRRRKLDEGQLAGPHRAAGPPTKASYRSIGNGPLPLVADIERLNNLRG